MSGQTIENKILECIKKCGRGKLIFSSDFVRFGEQKTVNKILERMAKEGTILRISRGAYYYPKSTRNWAWACCTPRWRPSPKALPSVTRRVSKLMPAWVSSIIKSLYEE